MTRQIGSRFAAALLSCLLVLLLPLVLRARLMMPLVPQAAMQINVGPNVHVSTNHPTEALRESWLSADPTDPNRLLACAIVSSAARNDEWSVVYVSTDRGQHWTETLTLETSRYLSTLDPACALGLRGVAHFVAIGLTASGQSLQRVAPVYRSTDGGLSWHEERAIQLRNQGMDRESIAVDTTGGPYTGRVYITGITNIDRTDAAQNVSRGVGLWTSTDGAVSFAKPYQRASPPAQYPYVTGSSVILQDGTLVISNSELLNPGPQGEISVSPSGRPNAFIEVLTSTDGGETLASSVKVADRHIEKKKGWVWTWPDPSLAVDLGSAAFADRLYIAWLDVRSGRAEILLSASSDKGKTWSNPQLINDVDPAAPEVAGENVFMPTVAVNKNGVVAVMWYDRHGTPGSLGWNVRFRASLDGGETWLPSVRVSSAPSSFAGTEPLVAFVNGLGGDEIRYRLLGGGRTRGLRVTASVRQFIAGDYSGMAADAGGVFHPLWTDNRTGYPQLWTAPVTVNGVAIKHGDARLAELDDLSERLIFVATETRFDRQTGQVTLKTRLKNMSRDTLRGPFFVRATALTTELANKVQAANAMNAQTGPGAVWEYAAPGGVLPPGAVTAEQVLTFQLTGMLPLYGEQGYRLGIIDMPVVMLGHIR